MIDFWLRFDQLVQARGLINKEVYSQASVTAQTFSQWRLNDRIPPADRAQALAKVLDTTVEYLVTGYSSLPMAGSSNIPVLSTSIPPESQQHWEQPSNMVGYLDIFKINGKAMKHYALIASGSSMLGMGIAEGDSILFTPHHSDSPLQDALYVFVIDNQVHCKRLEFDVLANTVKIFNMRTSDPKEAELIRTLPLKNQPASLVILGKVTGFYHAY